MNFQIKLCFGVLALVSTACTDCSYPCPCDSNNVTTASTETWQEPQEMPVVQQEVPVVQETQAASSEDSQTSTVIKRPSADLSEQLSLLGEPHKQKLLESEQAQLIPTAAEKTAKSVRT